MSWFRSCSRLVRSVFVDVPLALFSGNGQQYVKYMMIAYAFFMLFFVSHMLWAAFSQRWEGKLKSIFSTQFNSKFIYTRLTRVNKCSHHRNWLLFSPNLKKNSKMGWFRSFSRIIRTVFVKVPMALFSGNGQEYQKHLMIAYALFMLFFVYNVLWAVFSPTGGLTFYLW